MDFSKTQQFFKKHMAGFLVMISSLIIASYASALAGDHGDGGNQSAYNGAPCCITSDCSQYNHSKSNCLSSVHVSTVVTTGTGNPCKWTDASKETGAGTCSTDTTTSTASCDACKSR